MSFLTEKYKKQIRIRSRWLKNWLAFPFSNNHRGAQPENHHLLSYQRSRHTGPEKTICHAPLRSIYFGFRGVVVPCCFNREFIYGTYPGQSVAEIIGGPPRRELQKLLDTPDFSRGCKHCMAMINSGNYEGTEARLYDGLKKHSNGFPAEMIFELDNTCNLACVMCEGTFSSSILKRREGRDYEPGPYDTAFVSQLIPYLKHLSVAKFLGGEPFLIKLHYPLWETILKENPDCIINLQTNGTVYNEQIESLLKKGRFQIGISIDSLQKERFEAIRVNANFETVVSNLDKFITHTAKSGSFVNLSVCPMQQNWDEIPELVNFCNRKKIFIYFNTVYTKNFDLRELPSGELEKAFLLYKHSKINGRGYIARRNRSLFLSFTRQVEEWFLNKRAEEKRQLKRLAFSKQEFTDLFEKKLLVPDLSLREKLYRNLKNIPSDILLSEAQVEQLHQLPADEFTGKFMLEDDRIISERLKNFLDHGDFSIHSDI